MLRLTYDDPARDGCWNDEGAKFSKEIRTAIDPIIQRYCDEGYSRVDVESIIYGTLMTRVIFPFTHRSIKHRMEEENGRARERS